MTLVRDVAIVVMMVVGAGFLVVGTIGLVRFPDLRSRLHAVTKADGLGLGLIAVALAIGAPGVAVASKLLLTWLLAITGGTVACHLIAAHDLEEAEGRTSQDGAADD